MSLQDFELLGKLGAGSFGVVHKARDKKTNNIVVIKIVDISKMNSKLRKNAIDEGKILKEMNSPYIVKHFNTFVVKQNLHIVIEYCPKGDLAVFLKSQMGKPLKEEKIWRFSIQMMMGLRDLHAKKILHRDIKSMNIFLDADHNVRIGDLGVAKTLKTDFAYTIVGTPYYLSPEMCQEKPYNEKTDIWAMGCVIYELCTGKHPFQANNQAALALKIVMGKFEKIPAYYSSDLGWIVDSCLSVDYKRRPTASYLLSMPKVEQWAKKLNLIGKKLEEPKVEVEMKKQESQKSQKSQSESEKAKNVPVQKKQKSIEKVIKVPPTNPNKNLVNKSKQKQKHISSIAEEKRLRQQKLSNMERVRSKQAKKKQEEQRKSREEFFNKMKAENGNKKYSAAHKNEVKGKERQKINKQLPPKPVPHPASEMKRYESEKPHVQEKPSKIILPSSKSPIPTQKMNLTMNRFMPENVREKQLIDIEDEKRFHEVEIPDSDSSNEDKKQKPKKKDSMNRVVQMAQQEVDDDLLAEFGEPTHKKAIVSDNKQSPIKKQSPVKKQVDISFQLENKTKTINWDFDSDEEQTATVNEIKQNLQRTPSSENLKASMDRQTMAKLKQISKNESIHVCANHSKLMKELPTVKSQSTEVNDSMKVEQYKEEENFPNEEIAQEIDENRPYISDEEEDKENNDAVNEQQQLLIEDFNQKEQDLIKKQKQNQKRQDELVRMKNHYQSQILQLLPKQEYEKVKGKILEYGEDEIQQFVFHWKNNMKAINLFYRIIHFDSEIKRCHGNIETIQKRILEIKNAKN